MTAVAPKNKIAADSRDSLLAFVFFLSMMGLIMRLLILGDLLKSIVLNNFWFNYLQLTFPFVLTEWGEGIVHMLLIYIFADPLI